MSHIILHSDLIAVRCQGFPYQIEPKRCPVRFGGVEWLKNLPEPLGRDVDPGIADLQPDPDRRLPAEVRFPISR
jgi:hypothetical protein